MKSAIRLAALIIALACFAYAPANAANAADAKEGDWASGWTTWKDAAEGDTATYAMDHGIKVAWVVNNVTAGKIKHTKTTYANDKESGKSELTKGWTEIKLTVRPYGSGMKVEWTEETLTLSGVELKCQVATWTIGEATTIAYYCKDVPCGGFVKSNNNGKDVVWLTEFKSAKKEAKADPKEEPKEEPKVETKTQMPRFYATVGNSAVIKITGTGRDAKYQLRTVTAVAETASGWSAVACDKDGAAESGARTLDKELAKADWDKTYAKPAESGVKLTVEAGEFTCDVFKTTDGAKETTEWISEGAPVKIVIKSGSTETVLEAVKITMK